MCVSMPRIQVSSMVENNFLGPLNDIIPGSIPTYVTVAVWEMGEPASAVAMFSE